MSGILQTLASTPGTLTFDHKQIKKEGLGIDPSLSDWLCHPAVLNGQPNTEVGCLAHVGGHAGGA